MGLFGNILKTDFAKKKRPAVKGTDRIIVVDENSTNKETIPVTYNTVQDITDYVVNTALFSAEQDWVAPYNYIGVAPVNTPTSASVWVISRIEVFTDGTIDVKHATGSWNDRTTLIYT
jgi:hypothetical protein